MRYRVAHRSAAARPGLTQVLAAARNHPLLNQKDLTRMSNIAHAQATLNRLKNDVRRFKTATSGGALTPEQIQNLGSLLSDTIEVLDAFLGKQSRDLALSGRKIAQNDGIEKFGRSASISGTKVGQN